MRSTTGAALRNNSRLNGRRESMGLHGFTLVELILVMAIIAIIVGMAVPTLHGFAEGRRTSASADQLVALTKYARSQAITNGKIYRLYVQAGTPGKYWIGVQQDDGTYGRTEDSYGSDFATPVGVSLIWIKGPQQPDGQYIQFQPSGRTDAASLEIRGANNQTIDIACFSPTEQFHVVTASDRAKGLVQ
jgi:prepilin-type N-terminal cleavage/methylation domain-containing protein